jgi:hypothetical protein
MEALATSDARDRVSEAVDALIDESIDEFSTHALGADLIDIRQAIDRLEAEFIRRLHRFDRAHGALADGGVSTVSWLRTRCGMTVKAAAYRVHLARTLGELPATLDSARAGRASFSNVTMIAHLAEDVGVEQVAPLESILVGAAETLEPGAMSTLTQATRLRLDPDGVLADDNHAHERRWFECDQTYGGVFVLRGELDAEGGALVKTAIDALSHGMSRGETRTGSQRRADALVDLAATQLRCGDHRDVHGQRPHLTVTVSADTLRSGADAQPAELSGVGPIHPETARRLACDAVRTLVTVAPLADGLASTAGSTGVRPALGRPGYADDPGTHPHRAEPPRPGLPIPGVRPPACVDRWTSHHPLGGRRCHRTREPRPPLIHPLRWNVWGRPMPGRRSRPRTSASRSSARLR